MISIKCLRDQIVVCRLWLLIVINSFVKCLQALISNILTSGHFEMYVWSMGVMTLVRVIRSMDLITIDPITRHHTEQIANKVAFFNKKETKLSVLSKSR